MKLFNRRKYAVAEYTFKDGTSFTDLDIAKMVKEHTRLFDRLNYIKMCIAANDAFSILSKSMEMPKEKKWKFKL